MNTSTSTSSLYSPISDSNAAVSVLLPDKRGSLEAEFDRILFGEDIDIEGEGEMDGKVGSSIAER